MSEIIQISRLVNLVQFKTDNSYKKAQDKIKRMAGLWFKSSNQMAKSFEQGRRVVNQNIKSNDKLSRMEIRQQRTRKQTLRADNIRFKDTLNNNEQFKAQLQKINADFLKGNLSFKERSAHLGQLNKQYKQLNNQASKHNKISRIIGASGAGVRGMATSAATSAAIGVGTLGAAGYAAQRGFDTVKAGGQQYEALTIRLMNVFDDRAKEISDIIANMSDKNGRNIIDTGLALVEFVALMQPLGDNVDTAISSFQKYQDAMASYGLDKQASQGFMTQWSQALASNTLDSYQEAMRQWAPNFKADFETWIKKQKGINDFSENITGGKKYNLKKLMDEYLTANATMYSSKARLYKNSSMAQDERSGNALSLAIYRVFNTSGFSDAMKFANKIVISWANTLENNSDKIGQVFGNLYKIASELADGAFKELTSWLKDLKADDIKAFFNDFKQGLSDLAFVVKSVASFIRSFLPEEYKAPSREVAAANTAARSAQTGNWRDTATTYGPKIQQPTFIPPTFENSLVLRGSRNAGVPASNFSGTLDLKVNATVNEIGFSNLVDFKIDDFNRQQINMVGGF